MYSYKNRFIFFPFTFSQCQVFVGGILFFKCDQFKVTVAGRHIYPHHFFDQGIPFDPILDEVFGAQPMTHWYEVFNGVHVTFGVVRGPQEVVNDPQLRANNIIVPLEGAGGNLTSTISSPIEVHDVAKVPARRAPNLGEHNEAILKELGFDPRAIDKLRADGVIATARGAVHGD